VADLRISELRSLASADLASGDWLAIADKSASESRKISVTEFMDKAVTLLTAETVPSGKILFDAGSIPGGALVNGAVGETQIASGGVTASKLAANSTTQLVGSLPATGSYIGQLALDTNTNKTYIWNGSAWVAFRAAGSINQLVATTTGPIQISVDTQDDVATLTVNPTPASTGGIFLAGPASGGGSISGRAIVGSDLPTANTTDKGAVVVNGNGLAVSGDTLTIDNAVTPESTDYHVVQYDANGLVTDGRVITGADLPVATSGSLGVVFPGAGLGVDAAGELAHINNIVSGSAAKVSFDSEGHITGTFTLEEADIPDIPATKLTSGTLATAVLPNNGIAGGNLADYSVTQFGGPGSTANITIFPTAEYIGQFFWDESRRDLYIWSGTSWLPVTITSGELVFAGTYDAANNEIDTLTAAGAAVSGFTAGDPLPTADAGNNQYYFVVINSGTGTAPAPAVALQAPDQIVSNGSTWEWIDVSGTIAGNTASNITYSSTGGISASNVQDAITELDTEKLGKAGGTLTGEVVVGSGGSIRVDGGSILFEGSSSDTYETTLTVVDPTADRTITFPNVTGTVITSGDTGSVTNTMLAGSIAYGKLSLSNSVVNADIATGAAIAYSKLALSGSILNADINASAAIAYSKLNVANAITNADINTSAAIAYSKLSLTGNIVNADISGSAAIADSKLATISTAGKVSGGAITSGTIGGSAAINTSGTITTTGIITDGIGSIRRIPQNAKTAAYTLTASDVGKHISITTGGITVPASVFSIGDNVTIFNNSTSDQTITQGGGVTLRAGGSTSTGNRTLANYGVATVLCVAADVFVITGTGIT
jgi:hypothetical protein